MTVDEKPWVLVQQGDGDATIESSLSDGEVTVLWWNWDAWYYSSPAHRWAMVHDYRQMPPSMRAAIRRGKEGA